MHNLTTHLRLLTLVYQFSHAHEWKIFVSTGHFWAPKVRTNAWSFTYTLLCPPSSSIHNILNTYSSLPGFYSIFISFLRSWRPWRTGSYLQHSDEWDHKNRIQSISVHKLMLHTKKQGQVAPTAFLPVAVSDNIHDCLCLLNGLLLLPSDLAMWLLILHPNYPVKACNLLPLPSCIKVRGGGLVHSLHMAGQWFFWAQGHENHPPKLSALESLQQHFASLGNAHCTFWTTNLLVPYKAALKYSRTKLLGTMAQMYSLT